MLGVTQFVHACTYSMIHDTVELVLLWCSPAEHWGVTQHVHACTYSMIHDAVELMLWWCSPAERSGSPSMYMPALTP